MSGRASLEFLAAKYKEKLDENQQYFLDAMKSPESEWSLVRDSDGVRIDKRRFRDTGFDLVRAVGVISSPPEELFEVIIDVQNYPVMNPVTSYGKILQGDFHAPVRLDYVAVKAMFIISPRDFLYLQRHIHFENRSFMSVTVSIDDADYVVATDEAPMVEACTRGEMFMTGMHCSPCTDDPQKTKCVYLSAVDPKGWLPRAAVNACCAKGAVLLGNLKAFMANRMKQSSSGAEGGSGPSAAAAAEVEGAQTS